MIEDLIVVSVRSSSVRSVPLWFIPVNHQYSAIGQHAQLNIEGDLPIKNGLAEKLEGENCSLKDPGTRGRDCRARTLGSGDRYAGQGGRIYKE